MRIDTTGEEPLAVITGTGGLGYEAALALARQGFAIVLAGRNAEKGASAIAALVKNVPDARAFFEPLDLASLDSVRSFGDRMKKRGEPIQVLINNAGIMSPPRRKVTVEGYELQFGVNYLGHFALTACVLPLMAKAGRVVNVTSLAQHFARLDIDDLQGERTYHPGRTYCVSKLLQAMFAVELQRRSVRGAWGITSLAAHPGFAVTNLFNQEKSTYGNLFATRVIGPLLGQSAAEGASSLVYAATAPDAMGGTLYGPRGFLRMKGQPGPARYAAAALDRNISKRLWSMSERLAGVTFPD